MSQYALYIVPSLTDGFDHGKATYDNIREHATSVIVEDELSELLEHLIRGLNKSQYLDIYWYYITDETEGKILMI